MSNLKNYIKETSDRSINEQKQYYLFKSIPFTFKDDFLTNIDMPSVIDRIEKMVPRSFVTNIDTIYVGDFDFLSVKQVNALYMDGAIYLTNVQDDIDDVVDDIIHEIAHSLEERHKIEIYGDELVEREFLGKRKRLQRILTSQDIDINNHDFMNPEYDIEFDMFLYQDVGYPFLTNITAGLFYSPYAITSLSEYFANGFEAVYVNRDYKYLKKISPQLSNKIDQLTKELS